MWLKKKENKQEPDEIIRDNQPEASVNEESNPEAENEDSTIYAIEDETAESVTETAVESALKSEAESVAESTSESAVDSGSGSEPEEGPEATAGLIEKFNSWLTSEGVEPQTAAEAASAMAKIAECFSSGNFDDNIFRIVMKGADYDRAVQNASRVGEIRGRNANIAELMEANHKDDGVPHPGTGSGSFNPSQRPSIFELARGAW